MLLDMATPARIQRAGKSEGGRICRPEPPRELAPRGGRKKAGKLSSKPKGASHEYTQPSYSDLNPPELKLLQALIYQECGMYFDERRMDFLQNRLLGG